MMKCDMCYDRTSAGKRPMCATVCPSQALAYCHRGDPRTRREKPVNVFYFGNESVTTKVFMMVPAEADAIPCRCHGLHVGAANYEGTRMRKLDPCGRKNSPSTRPQSAT